MSKGRKITRRDAINRRKCRYSALDKKKQNAVRHAKK